jgi:hypothetical protein
MIIIELQVFSEASFPSGIFDVFVYFVVHLFYKFLYIYIYIYMYNNFSQVLKLGCC